MPVPVEVFFFPNGNTAVCVDGQQVPKLQRSWLLMFVEFLKESGVDPLTAKFNLPDRSVVTMFETGEGNYNWRIEGV
jgi:hypothetical protein